MNSAPHLFDEDRQEFERILDEALRTAPQRPDFAALGDRFHPEQLRAMALDAMALITAAAADEYETFAKIREEMREPSSTRRSRTSEAGLTTSLKSVAHGETVPGPGAGLTAVVAVLVPVLAGTAAMIFLLIGCVLKVLSPEPAFADTMLTAGWLFGAIAAVGVLAAAAGLLMTALRNGSTSLRADEYGARCDEVNRAREAWRTALLERGLLPFLRTALTGPDSTPADPQRSSTGSSGRMPRLGYHSPGFSSPDGGPAAGPRPSYSSPDYSSPDYGGSDHTPE